MSKNKPCCNNQDLEYGFSDIDMYNYYNVNVIRSSKPVPLLCFCENCGHKYANQMVGAGVFGHCLTGNLDINRIVKRKI